MAVLLSGETIAKEIMRELKQKMSPEQLGLSVIQVGDNKVSEKYIGVKRQMAEELGISFFLHQFPSSIQEEDLKKEIQNIGEKPEITGIIVQLPLPTSLNMQSVLDAIPIEKDIDVLSSRAFEAFVSGSSSILPPTVCAVAELLSRYAISIKGRAVLLVGAGRLVGLPLEKWFIQQGARVEIATRATQNLRMLTQNADIIVSGVGKPNLITGEMIQEGAVVIDAGTSVEGGKTTGDIDFESVSRSAGFVTPVPGGVGPLTVVCLFKNMIVLTRDVS